MRDWAGKYVAEDRLAEVTPGWSRNSAVEESKSRSRIEMSKQSQKKSEKAWKGTQRKNPKGRSHPKPRAQLTNLTTLR